mmetsp:Transcript_25530/g.73758  ORF Transcript_25530/g.73758 Transcript_25530/m.73758 type:complete len:220 (+) Transcript_25530:414-1073(+)
MSWGRSPGARRRPGRSGRRRPRRTCPPNWPGRASARAWASGGPRRKRHSNRRCRCGASPPTDRMTASGESPLLSMSPARRAPCSRPRRPALAAAPPAAGPRTSPSPGRPQARRAPRWVPARGPRARASEPARRRPERRPTLGGRRRTDQRPPRGRQGPSPARGKRPGARPRRGSSSWCRRRGRPRRRGRSPRAKPGGAHAPRRRAGGRRARAPRRRVLP